MTTLDYARAGDLLERFAAARSTFDGDAWVDLFTPDLEWHEDPYQRPRSGTNDLRRILLEASGREEQVEFTFERHWVVPPTILAPWHSSHVDRARRIRTRNAGFVVLGIAPDGRIRLARWWPSQPPTSTN